MAEKVDHRLKLMKNYEDFYSNSKRSDVILIVGKREFHVHRTILTAHSSYFDDLLYNVETKRIPIKASIEAFEPILKYFYSGVLELKGKKVEEIVEMLELSNRFILPELEATLMSAITPMLNEEHLSLIIKITELNVSEMLKKKCFEVLNHNLKDFFQNDQYLILSENQILEIFKMDNLSLTSIDKLKFLSKWIQVNPSCDKEKLLNSFVEISNQIEPFVKKVQDACESEEVQQLEINFKNIQLEENLVDNDPPEVQSLEQSPELKQEEDNQLQKKVIDEPPNEVEILEINCEKIQLKKGRNAQSLKSKDGFVLAGKCDSRNEIVLDLGQFSEINCLKFNLGNWKFSYQIYSSPADDYPQGSEVYDIKWNLCTSLKQCSGNQKVFFPSVSTKLIRIQGVLQLNDFRAFCVTPLPVLKDGYVCPNFNILTPENACVSNNSDDNMLKWDSIEKGIHTNFTESNTSCFIDVHLNQPYFLTKGRVRVWDFDGKLQRFKMDAYDVNMTPVEVLPEGDYSGWVSLTLPPNVYSYFQFYGFETLRIVHFEASA